MSENTENLRQFFLTFYQIEQLSYFFIGLINSFMFSFAHLYRYPGVQLILFLDLLYNVPVTSA